MVVAAIRSGLALVVQCKGSNSCNGVCRCLFVLSPFVRGSVFLHPKPWLLQCLPLVNSSSAYGNEMHASICTHFRRMSVHTKYSIFVVFRKQNIANKQIKPLPLPSKASLSVFWHSSTRRCVWTASVGSGATSTPPRMVPAGSGPCLHGVDAASFGTPFLAGIRGACVPASLVSATVVRTEEMNRGQGVLLKRCLMRDRHQ